LVREFKTAIKGKMYIFGWNISQKRMNRSVFPELTKVARKPIEVIVAGRAASMVMLKSDSQ
jgi:hypothetical protein